MKYLDFAKTVFLIEKYFIQKSLNVFSFVAFCVLGLRLYSF